MRKAIWAILILLASLATYAGSALHGALALVQAARSGDGAAVIARTDIPALRHSLTTQAIVAYLDALGQKRPVTNRDRLIANTAGASLAAAIIDSLLTPEALTELLKSGRVPAKATAHPMLIPALGQVDPNIWAAAKRIRLVQPTTFAIRIDGPADDSATEVLIHLSEFSWKLSGLKLPAQTLRQLAARIAESA